MAFQIAFNIFRNYYKGIDSLERIFLNIVITYLVGYIFLFITFLVSTGNFVYNYITIPLIFFPIISGGETPFSVNMGSRSGL